MTNLQPKRFRLEIEGVRVIAALLVAAYHIWFNRVSGGVDVFFVMSGFLITTSLFSRYRKNGRIAPISYIVKLLKRLIPSAWFIAIVTFGLSYFLAQSYTRPQYFNEFIASLFYFENWRLAADSVDYLASNHEASPFQHYWALSIQFQFYIIWALLFTLIVWLKNQFKTRSFQQILTYALVLIFISSLSFSIYFTVINQPVAYYHTFTRVWEFALGGLAAMLIERVQLSKRLAWISGWLGVLALLLCGIVLQVSTIFPGYAALWPTTAAILILLAGNTSTRHSAYQFLSSKPLVSFGKVSYAFYLWHWPILILFYQAFNRSTVSLKAGLAMIALSIALAYFTIYVIEKPVRSLKISTKQTAFSIAGMCLVIVGSLAFYNDKVISKEVMINDFGNHLGVVAHLTDQEPFFYEAETLNEILPNSPLDRSEIYADKCLQIDGKSDVIACDYGDTENYKATIALVGGSHSAQWQPMLDAFGKDHQVKITTMLKGNCRFSTVDTSETPDCVDWFYEAVDFLLKAQPDLVFTVGDASKEEWRDVIPPGFEEAWNIFNNAGLPLFLVRDTPRFDFSVAHCVINAEGDPMDSCKIPRDQAIHHVNLLEESAPIPDQAITFDPTDYFCDEDYCYPLIGNLVSFFDSNHMTASLAKSFAPIFEKPLLEALQL